MIRCRSCSFLSFLSLLSATLLTLPFVSPAQAQDQARSNQSNAPAKSSPPITSPPTAQDYNGSTAAVKLKIQVNNSKGNPVGNASVYVRYPKPGNLFHHGELAELDLKTNLDGSVRVPPVPTGKIQVQVIAKGWHTFGEWYDVEKDNETVTIQLQEPPHWY